MSWRDEVLTRCSGSQHPSSLPVEGAGHARVLVPPEPWCHALVATGVVRHQFDGYYVAYKPITLSSILFMFIEMKFIHCHSCVMFAMKSMSLCND